MQKLFKFEFPLAKFDNNADIEKFYKKQFSYLKSKVESKQYQICNACLQNNQVEENTGFLFSTSVTLNFRIALSFMKASVPKAKDGCVKKIQGFKYLEGRLKDRRDIVIRVVKENNENEKQKKFVKDSFFLFHFFGKSSEDMHNQQNQQSLNQQSVNSVFKHNNSLEDNKYQKESSKDFGQSQAQSIINKNTNNQPTEKLDKLLNKYQPNPEDQKVQQVLNHFIQDQQKQPPSQNQQINFFAQEQNQQHVLQNQHQQQQNQQERIYIKQETIELQQDLQKSEKIQNQQQQQQIQQNQQQEPSIAKEKKSNKLNSEEISNLRREIKQEYHEKDADKKNEVLSNEIQLLRLQLEETRTREMKKDCELQEIKLKEMKKLLEQQEQKCKELKNQSNNNNNSINYRIDNEKSVIIEDD